MATDGLWDYLLQEQIINMVTNGLQTEIDPTSIAQNLVAACPKPKYHELLEIQYNVNDDTTVVIIAFDRDSRSSSASNKSSEEEGLNVTN